MRSRALDLYEVIRTDWEGEAASQKADDSAVSGDSEGDQKYLILLTLFKYCPFAAAEAARKRQQEEGEERPEPRGHASLHDNGRNYAPRLRRDARQSDRANVLAVTEKMCGAFHERIDLKKITDQITSS